MERVFLLNEQSAWLYPSILTDSLKMDYPFQIACVQPPPPLRKNRRRGVCGEGATVHRLVSDGWSISSSSVKTANNKIPVSSVFNDSEGLYRKTVCRCLVHRPHYSARLMRFGSRGPNEFFSQIRHRNAFTEIAWEDAGQGLGMAMSTLASEKNRELIFNCLFITVRDNNCINWQCTLPMLVTSVRNINGSIIT